MEARRSPQPRSSPRRRGRVHQDGCGDVGISRWPCRGRSVSRAGPADQRPGENRGACESRSSLPPVPGPIGHGKTHCGPSRHLEPSVTSRPPDKSTASFPLASPLNPRRLAMGDWRHSAWPRIPESLVSPPMPPSQDPEPRGTSLPHPADIVARKAQVARSPTPLSSALAQAEAARRQIADQLRASRARHPLTSHAEAVAQFRKFRAAGNESRTPNPSCKPRE